ncbi:MAG: polysaccharide biosynthesis C-terminal domain-containing protein [Oscillospiraceae bacterium]
MPTQKKQSFLHGSLILVSATIIVKLVGACFKIPLTALLGGVGMGYFGTAYSIFNPIYTLSIAGFPVAISKMVSENMAQGRYRDVRKIRRIGFLFFMVTGFVGSVLLFAFSSRFAGLANNPGAYFAIMSIAPAVLFGCLTASFRGYYEGMQNMYPTAFSQVIEAVTKLTFGLLFAFVAIKIGMGGFESSGVVFGTACATEAEAHAALLPYAAAGAILGVTTSMLMGSLFLALRHRLKGDRITKSDLRDAPAAYPAKRLLVRMVKIAIPVCLSAIVISLTTLIDTFTIQNILGNTVETHLDTLVENYDGVLSKQMVDDSQTGEPKLMIQVGEAKDEKFIPVEDVPGFLYGSYLGTSINLFNLIPALATTIGVSALPAVSAAWAIKNRKETKRNIEAVIKITALIAIPAGLGMSMLSKPILSLLYSGSVNEVAVGAPLLTTLGLAAIFVAMVTPINSMLQAVGKTYYPLVFMFIGGVLKLVINYILVSIPSVNIHGAPVGTLVCYVFIMLAGVISLCRYTKILPSIKNVFVKPLIAGLFCGVTAWVSYGLLSRLLHSRITVVAAIGVGAIVYVIVLFCIKAIQKDDVLMLPKGEKIAKILEKKHLIG